MQKNKQNSMPLFEYFLSLLNTKVAYIDNKEVIDRCKYKNDKVYLKTYETKEELISILKTLENVPFKLVIDLSEIYDFEIEKSLKINEYKLNLRNLFQNSKIVKIGTCQNDKEIQNNLIEMLEYCDFSLIDNDQRDYFYMENDEVITKDRNQTLNKIKRLIK